MFTELCEVFPELPAWLPRQGSEKCEFHTKDEHFWVNLASNGYLSLRNSTFIDGVKLFKTAM